MLIHLFYHVGTAVPHKFCNVFLRYSEKQQFAGIVVAKSMKIKVRRYSLVLSAIPAPVIAYHLVGAIAYPVVGICAFHNVFIGFFRYRNRAISACGFGRLDDLIKVAVNNNGLFNVDVVWVYIFEPQARYFLRSQPAFSRKEYGQLVRRAFDPL